MLLVLALVAGGFAVSSVLRMRAEETAGRAELLLGTGLSRWRWTGGSLLVTVLGTAGVVAAGGLGLGVAHALVTGDAAQVLRLAGYVLVFLPAPVVLAGLLLGWLPGAVLTAWVALAGCLVIGWLGDLPGLPAAARDLSPFSHVPQVPLEPVTVGPLAGLTALAVVLGAAGLVGFRRRDVG